MASKYSERKMLEMAVEITKEYARGGGSTTPGTILKMVYKELKKINDDIKEDE